MNQPSNHTNQTQTGSSFPSQQSTQTNPFTGDLKGEFTSGFGTNTNTNAVSHIFKDSAFGGDNKSRYILYGAAGLVVVGLVAYLMWPSDPMVPDIAPPVSTLPAPDTQVADVTDEVTDPEVAPVEDVEGVDTAPLQDEVVEQVQDTAAVADSAPAYTGGAVALSSPIDGDSRAYNETMGPAIFSWEGGGGTIVFSRSRSMSPAYMRVPVSGNSYAFYNPYPGTWYWRVDSGAGSSEVRSFTVEPAVPRNLSLKAPLDGGTIAGNGGVVQWGGDQYVAFYRVEFSADGNWGNPTHRFASSSEQVQVQAVNPGQYQMRIGAFSEVAGRWEYSTPVSVSVQ